jgi:hypothetical protein
MSLMNRRQALIAPVCLLSVGCASKYTLPDAAPDLVLGKKDGLLITRLRAESVPANTMPTGAAITIINQAHLTIVSAILPVVPGETLRVLALPAGAYSWRGMYIGEYYSEFRGKMPFNIFAGAACYIGDLDIGIEWSSKRYKMEIQNRAAVAKSLYESRYPRFAQSLPFRETVATDLRGG